MTETRIKYPIIIGLCLMLNANLYAQTFENADEESITEPLSSSSALTQSVSESSVLSRTKASMIQPQSIESLTAEFDNRALGQPMPITTLVNEANSGNKIAQNNLGLAYFTGQGIAPNLQLALGWFQKSAEQGYIPAEYNTGLVYMLLGEADDFEQARYWFKQAAEHGLVLAQCRLAALYQAGMGGAPDFKQALYWYKKAADQGNAAAQANLGLMYLIGQGVKENPETAFKWFQRAARQGNAAAQINLAAMYALGTVTPKNLVQADFWCKRAMRSPVLSIQRAAMALHARIEAQMTQSERAEANTM